MRMTVSGCAIIALASATLAASAHASSQTERPLTPFRNTATRGGYTIDTIGDTLGQARIQRVHPVRQLLVECVHPIA